MTQPRTWQLLGFSSVELSPSGAFRSLRCLIYKVHASSAEHCYSIKLHFVCQELFSSFFKKFFEFRSVRYSALRCFSLAEVVTSATALLEYQTLPHLSTPFFTFFRFFFTFANIHYAHRLYPFLLWQIITATELSVAVICQYTTIYNM